MWTRINIILLFAISLHAQQIFGPIGGGTSSGGVTTNYVLSQLVWTNDPATGAHLLTEYTSPETFRKITLISIDAAGHQGAAALNTHTNSSEMDLVGGSSTGGEKVSVVAYAYDNHGVVYCYNDNNSNPYFALDPSNDNGYEAPYLFNTTGSNAVHTAWYASSNQVDLALLMGNGDFWLQAGKLVATNGLSSYSSIATNAITATGFTNTSALQRQAMVTQTAVAFTINDRSGAILTTFPSATATHMVGLQPGWSVRAASGLTGTVIPF